jgi:hypothetical protein
LVAWIKTLGSRPKAKSAVLVQDDDERVASVIGWYEAYFYALFLIGLVVVDFEAERLARFGVSVQEFVVAGAEFYKGAGKFAATGASENDTRRDPESRDR